MRVSRWGRRRAGRLVLALALLVPAGCATSAVPTAGASPFPVQVSDAQGTVRLSAPPQRVVTLGYADTQIAAALGAPIVGAVRSPFPDGNWPGVQPPLGTAVASLPDGHADLAGITAFHPDLILAASAQDGFLSDYPALSRIAPVLSHLDPRLGSADRIDLVRTIGVLLGRRGAAEDLIRGADAQRAAFAAAHPYLAGRSVVFGRLDGDAVDVLVGPSPTLDLLTGVGMRLPAALTGRLTTVGPGFTRLGPDDRSLLAPPNVVLLAGAGLTAEQFALLLDPNPAVIGAALALLAEVIPPLPPG